MTAPRTTPAPAPWRAARPALEHFGVMTLADIMTEGGADAVGARQELMYRERAALLAALRPLVRWHLSTDAERNELERIADDATGGNVGHLEFIVEDARALLATLDPPTAE